MMEVRFIQGAEVCSQVPKMTRQFHGIPVELSSATNAKLA